MLRGLVASPISEALGRVFLAEGNFPSRKKNNVGSLLAGGGSAFDRHILAAPHMGVPLGTQTPGSQSLGSRALPAIANDKRGTLELRRQLPERTFRFPCSTTPLRVAPYSLRGIPTCCIEGVGRSTHAIDSVLAKYKHTLDVLFAVDIRVDISNGSLRYYPGLQCFTLCCFSC